MESFRDLTLIDLPSGDALVIACDVSAGIGVKQDDAVVSPINVVAAGSLRVVLLELICFGAKLLCVVDTLGNEMDPTGLQVIQALKTELTSAGLADVPLNGSTEDNMATLTTSVGITAIAQNEHVAHQTDGAISVYRFGEPRVGLTSLATLISYDEVRRIRQQPAVVDMLPVGSKGIAYEVGQMAQTNQLLNYDREALADAYYRQSAGPATVVLVGVKKSGSQAFVHAFSDAGYVTDLKA
ncbi:hypothetical protein ACFP1H_05385 [Secundilactobacillus hailunensis]|uniref:Alpha-ribazole kinase n=1 Tax=Secundilactobacillus hailunensis TaxID=2559923 RepID=A0ABW1T9E2_9LACO|nr:hypothetical protein [Secundilactobacillus hailunensis]